MKARDKMIQKSGFALIMVLLYYVPICISGEVSWQFIKNMPDSVMLNEGNVKEGLTSSDSSISMKNIIGEKWLSPQRLFTVPTAGVLGTGEVSITGGSAIGVENGEASSRSIRVSLGGLADVEFSSFAVLNNISSSASNLGASALRIRLLHKESSGNPGMLEISTGLISSGSWSYVSSDYSTIQQHADWISEGIYSIAYQTRFTVFYISMGIKNGKNSLYLGSTLSDVRVKDTQVYYYEGDGSEGISELQKNLFGGFMGLDLYRDERTHIMMEAKSIFHYSFDDSLNRIDVKQQIYATFGVRYHFTRWVALDAGIWYGNRFKGIGDARIKLGLNIVVPLGQILESAAHKKRFTD